ncbi:MAG: hypothetical protein ILO42_03955 [Clostridia bacterium]|nr:hypothetical protein [Clostridia bacterium]
MYYTAAFSAVALLAVNFCLTSLFRKRAGDSPSAAVPFNMLGGAAAFLALFAVEAIFSGALPDFSLFSLIFAAGSALLCGLYLLIGFKIMSIGSVSVYTLFLMLGGMALPYFYGMIFLGEYGQTESLIFSGLLPESLALPFRITGFILMIASVLISGLSSAGRDGSKKGSPKFFLLCAAVFLLNGGVSILSKTHQLPEYSELSVSTGSYVMLCSLSKAVIFSAAFLCLFILQKRSGKSPAPVALPFFDRRSVLLILLCSAADCASYYLQLFGASGLPASVLYPLITGGSVILTTVCGALFFGERPSKQAVSGALLCLLSTFFFL